MFSVVISLYNKAPFVKETLDSVFSQSFDDFEVIVVDDGSTDGGAEVVALQYGSKVNLLSQSNQGVSSARNFGIVNSTRDYLAFLDADDIWHPEFLRSIHDVIENYPSVGMVGSSYTTTGFPETINTHNVSEIGDYFSQADFNTLFTSSSTVVHRSFFANKEAFKPHLKRGEDIDVWLRAFDWFRKAYYIQAPLMYYDISASESIKVRPDLQQTILFDMYKDNYDVSTFFPSWIAFRDKYLLLNLYQYIDSMDNFDAGRSLVSKMQNSYFFARLPYLMSFYFLTSVLSIPILRKLLRNYLKFCFRVIYTS